MSQELTTIVTSSNLDILILSWLDAKKRHSGSIRTETEYRNTLLQFRAGLQRQGLDLDSQDYQTIMLTAQAFAAFSARGKEVKPATRNQRLAIISSFYEHAIKSEMFNARPAISLNPLGSIERSKVQMYAGARPLSEEHIAESLNAIDRSSQVGKRDYALLCILLQTGRRLAEVEGLECGNLTLQSGKITAIFEHCKGGKIMADTLPYSVSNALLAWLQSFYGASFTPGSQGDHRPVWVTLKNGHMKTQRGEITEFRVGDALGPQTIADICKRRLGTSKVHSTRHTWAHSMKRAGADAATIQARLGHESLATTGRYLGELEKAENEYADALAARLGIR